MHFRASLHDEQDTYTVWVGNDQVAEHATEAGARRSAAANSQHGQVAAVRHGRREVARYADGRQV